MPTEQWSKVKLLFQEALELPPEQRATFCDAKCDTESMKAELRELLEFHEDDSEFLQSPINVVDSAPEVDPYIGRHVGDFRITKRIGAGGMGVVFEAVQEHPQRRVAIKLLQLGRNSEKMLWRLQHESEILARLQHPGVAHIYSSGMTDLGHGRQPWFAMELVDGLPLHRHAEQNRLSTEQKLMLFLDIADAVQHAHERGVIHRDLKPANIVVASDPLADATSPATLRPKVLDFGVARIVEEGGDPRATIQTEFGEIAGTISYMSPERFALEPGNVDHRCDVYALGVVGYELLSESLPINVRSNSIVDAIQAVEHQPPVPLGHSVPALRGDLEVIFAKALEKDPGQRYQSARDLADDVRRFLNNEPITARPPSRSYLVRKFVSRNRALVGGTLATIVALVAGMVLYANEARLARVEAAKSLYEAEKARTINNFIANDFLSTLLVDDVVDRANLARFVGHATENVSAMFGDQPALEAAVRNEVGTIYLTTGHYDLAVDEYSLALQLWTDELGREHSDTLKAVNNLGQTYARLGKADLAEPLYRRALDGRQKALGVTHSYTLASMNNLAELLRATGRMNEAEKLMRRALKLQRQEYGADDKHALIMTANLASLLAVRGQHEEAARMRQAVVNTMMDTLGRNHITTMHAKFELAKSLYSMKDYDAAQQILGPPIDTFDRISGAASFDTIKARRLMSRIQRKRGDINAARIELQKAIDAAETDPEKFAEVILKMEHDLGRLSK